MLACVVKWWAEKPLQCSVTELHFKSKTLQGRSAKAAAHFFTTFWVYDLAAPIVNSLRLNYMPCCC